jgi:hypothetical protein
MKIGDLIKVKDCKESGYDDFKCECWFCRGKSNRVGVVISPGSRNSWIAMFDCGEYYVDNFEVARGEVKVISESR